MASGFKSDAQGFLIGEVIENGRDLMRAQQQGIRLWKDIRSDVKSIARAVGAEVATNIRLSRPGAVPRAPSASPRQAIVYPVGRSAPAPRSGASPRATAPVVVAQPRAENGRFVAGQRPASGGAGSSMDARRMNDVLGRLATSLQAADRVDPTLDAVKELRAVVSPLGRGLFSLLGRTAERRKETWYRRILKALTPGKSSPQAGGGGGGPGMLQTVLGGMFGGIGGLLSKVPSLLMGVLTRIFLPIAAVWGAWSLGQWIGGKIFEWLEKSGFNEKLFDAIDAISGAFSSAWDSVTKGIDTVVDGIETTWKSLTDGFSKALDSFMAFPKRLEEFFAGLDESMRKIPIVGEAYGKAVDAMKKTVTEVSKGYEEGKSGETHQTVLDSSGRDINDPRRVDAGNAVGSDGRLVADPRRVDAPQGQLPPAATLPQAIGRDAGKVVRAVAGAAGKVADRWNGGARDDIVGAANAAGVDAGIVAKIARFESGFNSNAMPITKDGTKLSSAHGYGQFLDGTWTDMVNKHGAKYGIAGAGKLTKAQAGALRGDTKLQAAMLAEFTKENVAKGRKMGGSDDDANVYALHNLGEGDAAKLLGALKNDPKASVSSVLSGKVIGNNKSLYGDGSISVGEAYGRMGSYMRQGDVYAQDARVATAGYKGTNVAAPNIPALASSSMPSSVPPTLPKPPEVKEPAMPVNSAGAGRGSISISTPEVVGQNVGDRGIAHIASGGLGGGATGGW